ncbi:hypothetical protein BU15DRAFT_56270, partial [Melanogaster broomeanus]
LANNLAGRYKRAAGMALQITISNVGGGVATNLFRSQDAPRYIFGFRLEIIFICIGLAIIPITALTYKRINARREREKAYPSHAGGTPPMYDRAPSFRYTL